MTTTVWLPQSKAGFVIGKENPSGLQLKLAYRNNRIESRFLIEAEKCGFSGVVHGGILSAILDEIMGWAPAYEKGRMCMAAEITIRFLKPVTNNILLTAIGKFTEDKRRLWLAEGFIQDQQENVLVRGKGIYRPLSVEQSRMIDDEILLYSSGAKKLFQGE